MADGAAAATTTVTTVNPGAGAVQTPAPTAPGTNSSGGASSAPADWTSSLNDDLKGFVTNKGFKDPATALESYRNLEKLMGAPRERILKLPENMEDPTAMSEIYTRLGRPEKPADYQLPVPEKNGNPEFADWASKNFHELGLTTKQGRELAGKWNEFVQGAVTKQQEDSAAKSQLQTEALKKKWGAAYDQNMKVASSAAKEFGVAPEVIDAMEDKMGFSGVMEFFNLIGSKVGEPSFVTSGTTQGFGPLTPEAARNKISALKGDPDFTRRYLSGDLGARGEMERLHKMAYID